MKAVVTCEILDGDEFCVFKVRASNEIPTHIDETTIIWSTSDDQSAVQYAVLEDRDGELLWAVNNGGFLTEIENPMDYTYTKDGGFRYGS